MEGHTSEQQPKSTQPTETKLSANLQDQRDTERYQEVFTTYYATLCDAIPVEEVLPHLVSNKMISLREMEDVLAEKTTFRQTRALLNGPIWRAISGGYPKAFVTLLCVLRSVRSCKALSEEISTKLNITAEVITSESRELTLFRLCATINNNTLHGLHNALCSHMINTSLA